MSRQAVTEELRRWLVEQIRAGCRTDDILASMRASGWEDAVARETLQALWRDTAGPAAAPAVLPALPQAALPEPDLRGSPTRLWAHDREVSVLVALQHPRVVVFGGLLADDECDALVAAAAPRLARSETVVYGSGGSEVNAARTSRGMFFGRGETPLAERIEARIAALLRWPACNGEGLQVLHYLPGAEYKPHHDYFDPAQPGMASVLARGGQRVGTVVMYLKIGRAHV
jgi:prolyl 4-hydroxylase